MIRDLRAGQGAAESGGVLRGSHGLAEARVCDGAADRDVPRPRGPAQAVVKAGDPDTTKPRHAGSSSMQDLVACVGRPPITHDRLDLSAGHVAWIRAVYDTPLSIFSCDTIQERALLRLLGSVDQPLGASCLQRPSAARWSCCIIEILFPMSVRCGDSVRSSIRFPANVCSQREELAKSSNHLD